VDRALASAGSGRQTLPTQGAELDLDEGGAAVVDGKAVSSGPLLMAPNRPVPPGLTQAAHRTVMGAPFAAQPFPPSDGLPLIPSAALVPK